MSSKGFLGKIKERGITLRKSWKLGGRPPKVEHSIRKALDRALIVSTLRKTHVLLKLLLEEGEKPTQEGMRKLKQEVDIRIRELSDHQSG